MQVLGLLRVHGATRRHQPLFIPRSNSTWALYARHPEGLFNPQNDPILTDLHLSNCHHNAALRLCVREDIPLKHQTVTSASRTNFGPVIPNYWRH